MGSRPFTHHAPRLYLIVSFSFRQFRLKPSPSNPIERFSMTRHWIGTSLRPAALLLALAGCATSAGFESRMHAYVGRSEADLVASLGVPARVYQTEGRRFLQYERRKVVAESAGR
jgi:hypothetical protein